MAIEQARLDYISIHPAITVEVADRDAAAHSFGEPSEIRSIGILTEGRQSRIPDLRIYLVCVSWARIAATHQKVSAGTRED